MSDRLSNDLASLKISKEETNPDAGKGWRVWAGVALAVVVVVLAVMLFADSLRSRLTTPEVEITEIRLLSPAQSSVEVTSTGYVVAQTASKVGAKILGRVSEVNVKEGSRVKAGDVLAQLETAEQRASIAAARARFAAAMARAATARANHSETKRQYEREKSLMEQGASARSVVEDLENRAFSLAETVKAEEAEAEASKAELAALEVNLTYATIKAPIDGTVLGKPVEVGELVGPGTGTVVELADFASLMVETDVPEGRLHLVRPGSPAEIVLDAYPTKRHRGEVAEISPRVNRAKATVIVKVKFVDAMENVLPDMAARVSFLSKALDAEALKEPAKLFVPGVALTERNGEKVVFRVEDGRARLTPIRVGAPLGSGFEVVDGPRDGTKLVANPSKDLADGTSIKEKTR